MANSNDPNPELKVVEIVGQAFTIQDDDLPEDATCCVSTEINEGWSGTQYISFLKFVDGSVQVDLAFKSHDGAIDRSAGYKFPPGVLELILSKLEV